MSRSSSVTKDDFVFSDLSLLAVHRQRVKFKATLNDNQAVQGHSNQVQGFLRLVHGTNKVPIYLFMLCYLLP